ncbi:MAG: C10 family peptidase [bacterium]
MKTAVETWVRYITADARPDATIERMERHEVEGEAVAYIAHLSNGGFCLCGNNDMLLPVYLYSPRGQYDPQNHAYQYFLKDIAKRTQRLIKAEKGQGESLAKYNEVFEDRRNYWRILINRGIPQRKVGTFEGPSAVTLDLTSLWHQWSPYNDLCPDLTPGADEHCAIGCVAGSLAGIMRFWQWPITGEGSGSTIYFYRWRNTWDEEPLASDPGIPPNWAGGGRLEWTAAGGGKLRMNGYWDHSLYEKAREIDDTDPNYLQALETLWNRLNQATKNCNANFGATTYQWSMIEDVHTDPQDAGDIAVATLCYHAGVATRMDYGIQGSGTGSDEAVNAYKNNFRYDPDVKYVVKDTGNYASGVNDMMDEIQWCRPVQYYGWEMAHSWIIFAYNRTFLPDSIQWGMNSVNGSIDWVSFDPVYANHCFIRYIAPENVVRFVGSTGPGDGTPDDPYRDIDEALAEAPDHSTLIFKAGSDNTFSSATLVIDRPLTLKGYSVTIRKE